MESRGSTLMLRFAAREHGTLTLSMPTSFDRIGGRHNFAPLRLCVRLVCATFAERTATMEGLLANVHYGCVDAKRKKNGKRTIRLPFFDKTTLGKSCVTLDWQFV